MMHIIQHSGKTDDLATREDFCQVFERNLASLYQLAFLLTADHQKAQSIVVAGIDECAEENPVFRNWAQAWARRVIIRGALRLVAPAPGRDEDQDEADTEDGEFDVEGGVSSAWPGPDAPGLAVISLSAFNRFVFIMSVLERLSDPECAALLGCETADVAQARIEALRTIASGESHAQSERCIPFMAAAGAA